MIRRNEAGMQLTAALYLAVIMKKDGQLVKVPLYKRT